MRKYKFVINNKQTYYADADNEMEAKKKIISKIEIPDGPVCLVITSKKIAEKK